MSRPDASQIAAFVDGLAPPVCDALLAISGDSVIVDWRSPAAPELFDIKSVTKSVISILFGRLEREGMLSNLDMPLGQIFDEWQGTEKAQITLRQIMAQTSGLDASSHSEAVYASGDVVAFGLDLNPVEKPGQRFAYNNAATNLLPEIVRRLADAPFDVVTKKLLFDPLGITKWHWKKDQADNPLGMSGCALPPRALADLGRLMIADGQWHGRSLLAPDWRLRATFPCPPADPDDPHRSLRDYGLLWWLLYPPDERFAIDEEIVRVWRAADPPLDATLLERMSLLQGADYRAEELLDAAAEALLPLSAKGRTGAIELWHDNTWRRGLPDGRRTDASAIGFCGQGDRGQTLLCLPERRQVVVQLVGDAAEPASPQELLNATTDLFSKP